VQEPSINLLLAKRMVVLYPAVETPLRRWRARKEPSVFAAWGRFVYRHRRAVAAIAVLLALASAPFAARVTGELSSGGWIDRSSESAAVSERIANEFSAGHSTIIAVFRGAAGTDITSPASQAAIGASVQPLRADPRVVAVVGYAETQDRRFVSTAGDASYLIVQLTATEEQSVDQVDAIRALFAPAAGMTMQLTGYGPLSKEANEQSEKDLQLAETVSLPLALLILIGVFASVLAAGMPLLVAGLAIPTTLGIVYFLAQRTEMSIYVLNVSTMLGLALAIDYSLFLVSRFREELAHGRTTQEAVERSVATAGKAVVFSAVAVAIGLSGLLFFKASALTSIGVAGSLTVAFSALYAVTFLPATLGMLGPRINALSVGAIARRLGIRRRAAADAAGPADARPARRGAWERVALWVMAHPIQVLVPVLVGLLILGIPFTRLQQAVPDAAVFPAGLESRDAYVALQRDFPRGETTPIIVLADVTGDPTSPANALALATYARRLDDVSTIDRVEGPFSLRNPATGEALTPEAVAAAYANPQLRPQLQPLLDAYVRGSTVRLDAISSLEPARPASTDMIPSIRAIDAGPGISTQIGGTAAGGHDFLASMSERVPWAIGTTMVAMLVVLFLLFGSVVLPVKAVLMTLLSLTASFGALVWIFQEGNLSGFLRFESPGYTVAGNPILMFAILFGLSMDYEVLLLSRIQEAYRRTGDNRAAVAEGLSRTAAVITGAAMVMVVVFAAFALAEIVTIKSIGVGMAIAVFLDATVIRVLLVPATMRLMGKWNWWAPGPLGRLADRLGFSHVEDDRDGPVTPEGAPAPAPAQG
jgi:uncharacterized membrane protein YdfJ with MMPL/SSD domain